MARPANAYRSEALVLRVVAYGETSQIVHLGTPEHGRVMALAKGAHRPGPEFRGGLALAQIGEATVRARRGDLDLLQAFEVKTPLRGLADDLDRYGAALYAIDLLRTWMQPALPAPTLYRAGVTFLRVLDRAHRDALPAWVTWFEARALAAGGHRPQLDACCACGEDTRDGDWWFHPLAGGLVHGACRPPGEARRLNPRALDVLRRLYTERMAEFAGELPGTTDVRAARAAHDLFVPAVLERMPATLRLVPGR